MPTKHSFEKCQLVFWWNLRVSTEISKRCSPGLLVGLSSDISDLRLDWFKKLPRSPDSDANAWNRMMKDSHTNLYTVTSPWALTGCLVSIQNSNRPITAHWVTLSEFSSVGLIYFIQYWLWTKEGRWRGKTVPCMLAWRSWGKNQVRM